MLAQTACMRPKRCRQTEALQCGWMQICAHGAEFTRHAHQFFLNAIASVRLFSRQMQMQSMQVLHRAVMDLSGQAFALFLTSFCEKSARGLGRKATLSFPA